MLSGNTTWLSSKLHQQYIKKFNECWVPDFEGTKNLSGVLGHLKNRTENIKYSRPLGRFKKIDTEKKYDILVLLSGPGPQRSILEKTLLKTLKNSGKEILFIRGVMENNSWVSNSKKTEA